MALKDILPGKLGFGAAPLGNMFRDIPEQEALATVKTSRAGAMYTLVPNCSVVVAADIAPIVTHTSGHGVAGGQIGCPSALYGYGLARSVG